MKVVLFCGGMGMRLRDYSDQIPKPLVPIGPRPILWHLMKYYAHHGHKEFILCLGYRGNAIKDYFLRYDETASNDFVLSDGGRKIEVLQHDITDWKITFVDTGLQSSVGMRLRAARKFVEEDEMFLANYSDGLSDLDLNHFVEHFKQRGKTASFLSVAAPHTFHIVHADADQQVTKMEAVGKSVVRVNGGFFALRREIFDVLHEGEELVVQPFDRLIARRELLAVPHDGFWRNMDTFKDRQDLEELWGQGKAPWKIWNS
jgi:glucose-1-phosphate cytidylyltransferase